MGKQFLNQDAALRFLTSPESGELVWFDEWESLARKVEGGHHFEPLYYRTLRPILTDFLVRKYPDFNISSNRIRDVAQLAGDLCPTRVDWLPSRYIAFSDCLYDTVEWREVPFDGETFTVFGVPYPIEEVKKARMPVFERFLETTFVHEGTKEHDPSLVPVVQEMMGNFLIGSMEACSVFFLVGDGMNGKSKFLEVLVNIVGERFTTACTMEYLSKNNFATANLIGKRLNACAEEESKFLRSDKIKGLVSGDPTTAEFKYGPSITFRPTTKFVFASNNLPSFGGIDFGILRRVKIVPFYRNFDGDPERDVNLSEKLKAETPAILWWALEGARRLVGNKFVFSDGESEAILREKRLFTEETNSVAMWFNENPWEVADPSRTVTNFELYEDYREWCSKMGMKPKNNVNFGKDFNRMLPEAENFVVRVGEKTYRGRHIRRRIDDSVPVDTATEFAAKPPMPEF